MSRNTCENVTNSLCVTIAIILQLQDENTQ